MKLLLERNPDKPIIEVWPPPVEILFLDILSEKLMETGNTFTYKGCTWIFKDKKYGNY